MVQVLASIYFVRSDSSQSLNYKARLFFSFDKKNRFMDDSSQKCRLQIKIIITNVKALQKRFNIHCKLLFFFLLKMNLGFISDFCSLTSFIVIPSLSVFVRIVHHLRQGCYCSQRCFKSKIKQNALRFQNLYIVLFTLNVIRRKG